VAPDVPGKLFSAFNTEDLQLSGVAAVVAQDPLLTAKILKLLTLGNIEVSRAHRSVENIVEQLGTFRLKSILIPEAVRGLFFPQARFFWKEWWEHSAVVARLSKTIAGPVGYPFPEEAYLAGLLHNLGAFILMRGDPEKYRQLVAEAASRKVELEEFEEKVFGVSHSRAGTVYAEKWNFPKSLVHVIRLHHRIETDSRNLLLNIIAVAQGVAAAHGYGVEYAPSLEPQFELALKQLRIPRHRAIALLGRSRQPSRTVPNHEPTK
jgi:HD-like signal output (HDOD) protein